MAGIMDFIPVVQEWQLRRLLDKLYFEGNIQKMFPGFFSKAYRLRAEGVDWVDVSGHRIRVVKTMSRDELQYDQDVFFRIPHRAVQMTHNNKLLVVGFWCDNITDFEKWLKEVLDAHTHRYPERSLFGQIPLEATSGTPTPEHSDGGLLPGS